MWTLKWFHLFSTIILTSSTTFVPGYLTEPTNIHNHYLNYQTSILLLMNFKYLDVSTVTHDEPLNGLTLNFAPWFDLREHAIMITSTYSTNAEHIHIAVYTVIYSVICLCYNIVVLRELMVSRYSFRQC